MPVKIFLHQRVSTGSGVFCVCFSRFFCRFVRYVLSLRKLKRNGIGTYLSDILLVGSQHPDVGRSGFPHHHHAERLCLKSDWCTCTSDASCEGHCTHSPNTDNHECTISCATHFAFGHQQLSRSDVSPDFTFSFLIYPMLSLLEYFQTGVIRIGNSDSIYIEKLHSRQWMAAWGLRAPPVFLRS